MKIDFLVADNLYGSTLHFAKAFTAALEREGAQTRLHWIGEGHFFHALESIYQDPPDLTCSFSDIHFSGSPIGDLWQIPHLSLLIDPAIYYLHQLQGEYSWVSCVDEGDVELIRSLNFEKVFYLPHGGDSALLTPPLQERPYEVVFFGSCSEYETEDDIVLEAASKVLSPRNLSIVEALLELDVKEEDLARHHFAVDLYTRFHDRVNVLRALKTHTIHIWGKGPWKKYVPEAIIHPAIPFEETVEIMKKAKVVVNSSPRFKRGLHERILYGSLCGAAVLSGQGGGYTYRYGEWEDLSFADWKSIAQAKQEEVLEEHTWDHRARSLLHHLGLMLYED